MMQHESGPESQRREDSNTVYIVEDPDIQPFHHDPKLNLIVCNDNSITDVFLNAITETKRDCTVVDTFLAMAAQKQDEVIQQQEIIAKVALIDKMSGTSDKESISEGAIGLDEIDIKLQDVQLARPCIFSPRQDEEDGYY
jgi:hypothetical protein